MKQLFSRIANNEIVKSSFVLFLLFNFFNFLNYLFQMLMARFLGPSDFGILSSLMALIYISLMAATSIQLISAKYSAQFHSENNIGKIKSLYIKLMSKSIKLGIICLILFAILSFFLSKILEINSSLIIMTGFFILLSIIITVSRGVLHGMQRFWSLGTNMIIEGTSKLIIAIGFVFIGWKVYGAIGSMILSVIISFIISLFFIKDVLKSKKEKINIEGRYSYSFSVLFCLLVIFLMFSIDVLIAKALFEPKIVGLYSVASLIGKIIFFGTDPISKAMFPIASGKQDINLKKKSIGDAVKLLFFICGGTLIVFAVLPSLVVGILFGKQYIEISNLIWITGLAYTFLAFASLFIHYGLSGKGVKNYYLLMIFPIITIILMYIFSSTIITFASTFVVSNLLLLVYSIFIVRKSN